MVEPHRLVSLGRRWYLVAWDLDRADWRTFRVDRLVDPVPTGARFRPRELPDGDAAAFVRRQIAAVPTRYRVEVRIDAPAEAVRRVVGRWATVDAQGDAACVMRMNTDYLDWPVAVLAAIGAGFDVLEPAELRERVRDVGRLFARVTEAPGRQTP